jgi:shikimate dehydrogenase
VRARRFAVVGDPVGHSMSPVMQGAAMRALGLPHTYDAVRATADELPGVVARLREGDYDGLNVTVPHKERVLSLVDALDESARVAGAANTLVRGPDGRLVAHNTDAPALAAELARLGGSGPWPADGCGLVLGAGGAARAAIVALGVHLGIRDIAVRARAFADPARRDAFVRTAPRPVTPEPWAPSGPREARTIAIVQATSAGMRRADGGQDAGAQDAAGQAVTSVVAWDALAPSAVAIDVVYAPRDTPWLRAARRRGLRCDDGLGMLARQGALALELWLADEGVKAPLDAMRAALE